MEHKVFLVGLSVKFSEEQISTFFQDTLGVAVKHVNLLKNKKKRYTGCAVVELVNAEAVEKILAKGKFELKNRRFFAKPHLSGEKLKKYQKEVKSKRVFIHNVDPSFTNKDIRLVFSELAPIEDAFLIESFDPSKANALKYGYVMFKHLSDAQKMIQRGSLKVKGCTIIIMPYGDDFSAIGVGQPGSKSGNKYRQFEEERTRRGSGGSRGSGSRQNDTGGSEGAKNFNGMGSGFQNMTQSFVPDYSNSMEYGGLFNGGNKNNCEDFYSNYMKYCQFGGSQMGSGDHLSYLDSSEISNASGVAGATPGLVQAQLLLQQQQAAGNFGFGCDTGDFQQRQQMRNGEQDFPEMMASEDWLNLMMTQQYLFLQAANNFPAMVPPGLKTAFNDINNHSSNLKNRNPSNISSPPYPNFSIETPSKRLKPLKKTTSVENIASIEIEAPQLKKRISADIENRRQLRGNNTLEIMNIQNNTRQIDPTDVYSGSNSPLLMDPHRTSRNSNGLLCDHLAAISQAKLTHKPFNLSFSPEARQRRQVRVNKLKKLSQGKTGASKEVAFSREFNNFNYSISSSATSKLFKLGLKN